MAKGKFLEVNKTNIAIFSINNKDYISLTDMTSTFKEGSGLVGKWITNKNTLEYLGVWEKINNTDFKYPEFRVIEKDAGTNRFIMSVGQWIERTKASGMLVKMGRYGGTFAHKDIAFHFAMWLSPEFQIYLVNEFQRLKNEENDKLKLEWNIQRTLAKVNYSIHTDAIKQNLIPTELTKQQEGFVYANEADLLNVALFGMTAREWRDKNSESKGNIRDEASIEQLVVLSNIESINALLIEQNIPQNERLYQLNKIAIRQIKSLINNKSIKKLQ